MTIDANGVCSLTWLSVCMHFGFSKKLTCINKKRKWLMILEVLLLFSTLIPCSLVKRHWYTM